MSVDVGAGIITIGGYGDVNGYRAGSIFEFRLISKFIFLNRETNSVSEPLKRVLADVRQHD